MIYEHHASLKPPYMCSAHAQNRFANFSGEQKVTGNHTEKIHREQLKREGSNVTHLILNEILSTLALPSKGIFSDPFQNPSRVSGGGVKTNSKAFELTNALLDGDAVLERGVQIVV